MKYLEYHDWPDWDEPELLKHNVHIHDMAMIAAHDIPCNVCWDNPAVFERNMTPGEYTQSFQPCHKCQEKGWRLVKTKKKWWNFFCN